MAKGFFKLKALPGLKFSWILLYSQYSASHNLSRPLSTNLSSCSICSPLHALFWFADLMLHCFQLHPFAFIIKLVGVNEICIHCCHWCFVGKTNMSHVHVNLYSGARCFKECVWNGVIIIIIWLWLWFRCGYKWLQWAPNFVLNAQYDMSLFCFLNCINTETTAFIFKWTRCTACFSDSILGYHNSVCKYVS